VKFLNERGRTKNKVRKFKELVVFNATARKIGLETNS